MSQGRSTINTILKIGATAASLTKISPIKSTPTLFGTPERLETTDLEDTNQTFVDGVKSLGDMSFTANYDLSWLNAYKALEGTEQIFQLEFGDQHADGVFCWKGYLSVAVNEGSVNGIRELTLNISQTTDIEIGEASSKFPAT